ncbi:hypothetical protein MXEN_20535 [Mycobacterium xenopi RIVM700367]|nr:hypothetical protein MXEN_20535 [Mycobacterium xenopi RIVM700367]
MGEDSRVSATALTDETDSLRYALLRQVDQMLPHIWVPVEVVDDATVTALRLSPGLQLLVEVRVLLQVLVDRVTDGLVAWRICDGCAGQG